MLPSLDGFIARPMKIRGHTLDQAEKYSFQTSMPGGIDNWGVLMFFSGCILPRAAPAGLSTEIHCVFGQAVIYVSVNTDIVHNGKINAKKGLWESILLQEDDLL